MGSNNRVQRASTSCGATARPGRIAAGETDRLAVTGQRPVDPDPARFVPTGTLQAVLAERNEAQAVLREQRAQARVDGAFARGYLSPAMRDWAMALCRSDEASFDQFIEKSVPQFAHLFQPPTTSARPPGMQPDDHSAEAKAICEQLGLKPGALSI